VVCNKPRAPPVSAREAQLTTSSGRPVNQLAPVRRHARIDTVLCDDLRCRPVIARDDDFL